MKTIFLYDSLMSQEYQKRLGVQLEFICYGYTMGKLMRMPYSKDFGLICPINPHKPESKRHITSIYGGIFMLKYPEIDTQKLDAAYGCSMSIFNTNHPQDIAHRKQATITIIDIPSLFAFKRMEYWDLEDVTTSMYEYNYDYYDVETVGWTRRRVKNQIFGKAFKAMYKENKQ